MARKTGRGGTRPTGPNSTLQGKPLGVNYSQPKTGAGNGNGNWDDCACVEGNVKTPIVRGSRKSF